MLPTPPGLIVSALRMACKALLPDTPLGLRLSADVYFLLAALLLCACIAAFLRLERVPFVARVGAVRPMQQALSTAAEPQGGGRGGDGAAAAAAAAAQPREGLSPRRNPTRDHGLLADRGSVDDPCCSVNPQVHAPRGALGQLEIAPTSSALSQQGVMHQAGSGQADGEVTSHVDGHGSDAGADASVNALGGEREALLDGGLISSDHYISSSSLPSDADGPQGERQAHGEGGMLLGASGWQTLQQIWKYTVAITSIYVVTLSLFPGFLTELKSPLLGSWFPVVLTSAMNLTDFVGKMFPAIAPSLISPLSGSVSDIDVHVLLGWSLARVPVFFVLFPLFSWSLPEGWLRDVLLILTTFAFGFSNGILTSCLMMAAPNKVAKKQAETAGVLMVLFLVTGLLLGSMLSWAWLGL